MRPLLPLLTLVTITLNGCSYDHVRGEDKRALFAEGEVVVELGKADHNDPKRRVNTLSAGYIRTEGVSEQSLWNVEDVTVNGQTIHGPVMLENDLKLSVGYLRFVRHMFTGHGFEWYWGAGLGYSHLNYTGTTPYQQVNFIDTSAGLHGQFGLAYHFNPQVALEAALGGYHLTGNHDAILSTHQLVLIASPTDALRVFAGYRAWGYTLFYSAYDPSNSNIEFNFAGPTVGATLAF